METKFCAMIKMAEDKYFKLTNDICKLKDGEEVNFEEILKLINSIHRDEIDLIVRLREVERQLNGTDNIQLMDFMKKRA